MARKSSKKSSKSNSWKDKYLQVRERLEQWHEVHAVILVIMTILVAAMVIIVVNQKIKIRNLEFERDFIEDRYQIQKEYSGRLRTERESNNPLNR